MERNPRVLILPASHFARDRVVGGGERYATEYARALVGKLDVELGLFDVEPRITFDGNLPVRVFPVRCADGRRLLFPFRKDCLRMLGNYDVIHLMCFPTPLSDLVLSLAKLRGQLVVLTDVGGGSRTMSGYLSRVDRRLNLYRLAGGIAHLSEYASGFYRDWVQPQTVLLGGTSVSVNERPAPFDGDGYALFVGRLLPHKGVLELIRAVDSWMPLKVVGRAYDAVYFEQLKREAVGKRVEFITDADDAVLNRLYSGAALVLQTSLPVSGSGGDKSELLGLVALEGMAHGRPVIVTRTASLPELVIEGVTGFIVPPRDLGALRDKIAILLSDRELAMRMGAEARHHVCRKFSWQATAERGLEFYRAILRR